MITQYEFDAIHKARTGELERGAREKPAEASDAASGSSSAGQGVSRASYAPNHIPLRTRVWNVCLSVLLIGYGTLGLVKDWLLIPGKRSSSVILHGPAVWIMCVAMLCAVLNLLSVLADHYDTRNNEHDYKDFARLTYGAGIAFFVIALLVQYGSRSPTGG